MSIAKYAMTQKQVIYFFLLIFFVGGILAFDKLGKQEDAPFVIKEATFTTLYPGANQYEVEELVTEVIERELQSHWGVDWIKSQSRPGQSVIQVSMYQWIPKETFNQIWDELRRKALDVQSKLPPGASTIRINDDFGDVFGIYYALTADEGYKYSELEDYADFIKRELVTVQDVKKVDLYGAQPKVVNVEISQEKLVNAGVHPNELVAALQAQNKLVQSGYLPSKSNEIRIDAKGTFQSLEEIENLIIRGKGGNQFRLKDLATVSMGYEDPAIIKFQMNGKRAIGIGISTRDGGNSVVMGELVAAKLKELVNQIPVGIELEGLYFQDQVAVEANNDFIKNLFISVAIVVFIILLAMGVRAGILIGSSLIFSILGTLLFMLLFGIDLHRTSLAAIIIAMGMLVDNAIVVTDNAMMGMKRGMPKAKAFISGASIPQWGLLGATFIAVISFLPLYMAPNNTAEIIKPLFVVLAISLILSWVFALIQTTTFGYLIFKEPKEGEAFKDPYDKKFYKKLRAFIEKAIRFKWVSLGIVVAIFFISLYSFSFVKQSFFPPIDKPMFRFDYWVAQGTPLTGVEEDIKQIEEYLLARDDVRKVSISIGASPLRYYLASIAVSTRTNFANLLIELDDYRSTDAVMDDLKEYVVDNFPNAVPIIYKFKVSPHPDATVEAVFDGPDPAILRDLAEQAKEIMRNEPIVELVRDSWGEKTMFWTPVYSQNKGQQAGVSRENMASTMLRLTDGQNVGEFREGDDIIPILVKDINRKNYNYGNMGSIPIYNMNSEAVSLDQVVEGYDGGWENLNIRRYNRQRSIAAQCEPVWGYENTDAEAVLMPLIEQIELPEGYRLWWDGIYEDQTASSEAIIGQMPVALILIISILIILFGSYKKTLSILLLIPLIMIGVIFGFLISGLSFGFFAILGLLGLIGMVIKNAIVLIDQSNLEMKENNRTPYEAIVLAAQSRAMPVAMAAGTTILGMTPLIPDPMFGGMAATIMGGLFVATILTIFLLPVLYSIFYGLSKKNQGAVVKDME